ncbi:MAG: TetR/AcrR family transcriptional regulator [Alphaproteobacteria bacterium]|nr:TetR/AcrR family transcriptional regulator [Alphaproteobacteria bacterium]
MRKIPRQARARQTVEYILEAAACILAERGLEGFTTNHIAERAGVNISSLYQYFPDKLAILEALRERHVAVPDQNYAVWLERSRDLPLEEIVRAIVDLAISMHASNPAMHKLFLEALPRQRRKADDHFEAERIAKMASMLLGHCRASLNPEMMLFILRHALSRVLHEVVCERPEWLKDPVFREELVTLLVNYLRA